MPRFVIRLLYRLSSIVVGFAVWVAVALVTVYSHALLWYGWILYGALPDGPSALTQLRPLNRLVRTYIFHPGVVLAVGIAAMICAVEIRRTDFQLTWDPTLRVKKQRQLRREWADKYEAWKPPESERDSPSIYDELRENVDTPRLVLQDVTQAATESSAIRGTVENVGTDPVDRVYVNIELYDAAGDLIGEQVVTAARIGAGDTWQFEAYHNQDEAVAEFSVDGPHRAAADS